MRPSSLPSNIAFPLANYPGGSLSGERQALLNELQEHVERATRPSEKMIEHFFDCFIHMGPRDTVMDSLLVRGKGRALSVLALSHLNTFGAGQDYLARKGLLYRADADSLEFLRALPADWRSSMLDSAEIGDRYQIVVKIPDVALSFALGRSCFGHGEGALTFDEAKRLLLNQQEASASLLTRFSDAMKCAHSEIADAGVWDAWSDLIRRCLNGRTPAKLTTDTEVLRSLGMALRTLYGRSSDAPYSRLLMLHDAAAAFRHAGDLKSSGKTWMEIASFHAQDGERGKSDNATIHAASSYQAAAIKLLQERKHSSADKCQHRAVNAFRQSGDGVRADLIEATYQILIERQYASLNVGRPLLSQTELDMFCPRTAQELCDFATNASMPKSQVTLPPDQSNESERGLNFTGDASPLLTSTPLRKKSDPVPIAATSATSAKVMTNVEMHPEPHNAQRDSEGLRNPEDTPDETRQSQLSKITEGEETTS